MDRPLWPALPLAEWQDTKDTLHLWTQIVGKIRLGLAPMVNHWWQVPLYVNARGLTTSAMPYAGGAVELTFDFLDHVLRLETTAGDVREVELKPRSVADFYREVKTVLRAAGVDVRITTRPVEIAEVIPFDQDEVHGAYDGEAAQRFWRLLVQADRVLHQFRSGFTGKCSPVHFWWGGFDLACTRFSGRPAPVHPGGVPNCPDYVQIEAYSHERSSAGWWPGGPPLGEPAFYAYTYPAPDGYSSATMAPAQARFDPTFGEWLLPYEVVRQAADPDATLLTFLESAYDVGARLGNWDRDSLERSSASPQP